MADGELTLKLDDNTANRLAERADLAGVSVEAYVLEIIADDLGGDALAVARARLADYDRTGQYITVEDAMAHFDHTLETRSAKPR